MSGSSWEEPQVFTVLYYAKTTTFSTYVFGGFFVFVFFRKTFWKSFGYKKLLLPLSTNLWKSVEIFHCVKVFKNQDKIIYEKRKKEFGLSALTPQAQKKISDHRSKGMRGDAGGNDTLDINSLRDDGGTAYSLSGEIN